MIKCSYCHGEIESIGDCCPCCGCDRAHASGEKTFQSFYIGRKSMDLILTVGLLAAVAIIALVMTFVFGDNPDKLASGLGIVIGIAAGGAISYGISYQRRRKKMLTDPNMKVVTGRVADVNVRVDSHERHFAIVEYEYNGHKYRYVSHHENCPVPVVDKEVDVVFSLQDPHECYIVNDNRGKNLIIIVSVVTVMFAIAAISVMIAFNY